MACSMLLEVMMGLRASTGTLRPTVLDAKLCAGAEVANTLQTFGLISISFCQRELVSTCLCFLLKCRAI